MLIKKNDFDQRKRKSLRKKGKKNQNKSTLDIVPIKTFTDKDEFTKFVDGTVSQTYKLNTVAINDISQSENNALMIKFAKLLRMYDESIKITSSNFFTNTIIQIAYWQEQLSIAEKENKNQRIKVINEKIVTLKVISRIQINKEHYISIYAKDIEDLKTKINIFLFSCSTLIYPQPLNKKQKSQIFEDFNNPRVFD
ncbi:hypothetical protein [Staphylococcus epidermidis]|uniref:hypothetical protein n=1 Tax=Staphylococcus epidermidis TaxID=1282 RepID=UPI0015FD75F6